MDGGTAQPLSAYLSPWHLLGGSSEKDLILAGARTDEGSGVQSEEIRGSDVWACRKQLVYYTISRAFINIPGIIVSYSFPQTLCSGGKKKEKGGNFTMLMARLPMQLLVPLSPDGLSLC